MKKSKLLTVLYCLIALSNVAYADSLDNLLNDVNKRISLVEKVGDCKVKSNFNNMTECEAVIAKCPAGTILVPKPLSKCSFSDSNGDKPQAYSYFSEEKSNEKEGQQVCNITWSMMPQVDYSIKSTAACAKIPKAVPGILKKFGADFKI